MARRKFARTLGLGAEGVDPSVQFHAALMTFVDHPGKRVPVRRRRRSLSSRKETGPRFVGGLVHGIGLAAHLKDDGIDATPLHHIELVGQILLHFAAAHALELTIDHLNPRTAKFAFGQHTALGADALKRGKCEKQKSEK